MMAGPRPKNNLQQHLDTLQRAGPDYMCSSGFLYGLPSQNEEALVAARWVGGQ